MVGASAEARLALGALAQHWELLSVALMALLGATLPGIGLRVYDQVNPFLIRTIFALAGLTLPLHELGAGLRAVHVHCAIQGFSLLATPLAYWSLVYSWRWEVRLGLLSPAYAAGTMAALCMPTTTSTSLVFVQQAGGDASVAVLNMAAAQILGALISPVVAQILLGGRDGAAQDVPAVVRDLGALILLPLALGAGTQQLCAMGGCSAERMHRAAIARLAKRTSNAALVCLFYLIFAKAFGEAAADGPPPSTGSLAALVIWVSAVHLALVGAAWRASAPLPAARRVSFVLVAPQKTEAMAVAILGVIFARSAYSQGELIVPIVAYHSVRAPAPSLSLARAVHAHCRLRSCVRSCSRTVPSSVRALADGVCHVDAGADGRRVDDRAFPPPVRRAPPPCRARRRRRAIPAARCGDGRVGRLG